MKHYPRLQELQALVGQELGLSDWVTVEQKRIDQFADATGDHQWIHVDPAKAAQGPFGRTIAHGFLTLSLLPELFAHAFEIGDVRMGVNYGLNKVRFMAPVPVGSRLRSRMTLLEATPVEGGQQLVWKNTLEREGSDKPVCVAESVARYYT